MQILSNAITNPISDKNKKNPPLDAISAVARDLYQNGESFCDCSKKASDMCPLCPSFMSFKTLLYESLDACQALDEIDCDAWSEFWKPCQNNLESEFSKSDFKSSEQCEYTKNGCGGVGAFPAFRKLDCDKEIDNDAWQFYKKFSKNCLKGDAGKPPDVTPAAAPTKTPTAPTSPVEPPIPAPTNKKPSDGAKPTPKPYIPSDSSDSKPYTPSDAKGKSKKKSHWFRNLLIVCALGGGGYYLYKRRVDAFHFVQYRRVRNFGNFGYDAHGGDDDAAGGGMYSNLNSSTSFEPPSLPPTPQMMGTEMT
jgi:hypothetical protein